MFMPKGPKLYPKFLKNHKIPILGLGLATPAKTFKFMIAFILGPRNAILPRNVIIF